MRWKIIHNGYDIQWVNRESDIDSYIQSVLESHSDLRLHKIMDRKIKVGDKQIRIVRYIYVTLYEEDFIIEPA